MNGMSGSAKAPPGWYPDPENRGGLRYWDGDVWTDQRSSSSAARSTDAFSRGGRWRWVGIGVCVVLVVIVVPVLYEAFAYFLLPEEEELDPSVQPLEIVVDSLTGEGCVLNVEEVEAGTHEVSVIAVESFSRVRIADRSGEVVYEATAEPQDPENLEQEQVRGEGPGSVSLSPGRYQVECTSGAGASESVQLTVLPAGPE